jgi:hypothetical protein
MFEKRQKIIAIFYVNSVHNRNFSLINLLVEIYLDTNQNSA